MKKTDPKEELRQFTAGLRGLLKEDPAIEVIAASGVVLRILDRLQAYIDGQYARCRGARYGGAHHGIGGQGEMIRFQDRLRKLEASARPDESGTIYTRAMVPGRGGPECVALYRQLPGGKAVLMTEDDIRHDHWAAAYRAGSRADE